MKVTIQSKVAELEGRIDALEKAEKRRAPFTQTTTMTTQPVDLEPELSGIWASVDALFKKVFK